MFLHAGNVSSCRIVKNSTGTSNIQVIVKSTEKVNAHTDYVTLCTNLI